jgi:prolyl oligopeptidase
MPLLKSARKLGASLALASLLVAQSLPAFAQKAEKRLAYPQSKKVAHVEEHHGVKVEDPYRWLEDLDSTQTKAWVEAQNKVTFAYLNEIPERDSIKKRLTKLWNYERYSIPSREGDRYFYTKNNGLQNQSVVYTTKSLNEDGKVLLDPNTLSTDGTVALTGTRYTKDGKLMAYGLAASGSDWQEWHVRDVETGKDLPDVIKWVKFSGASWALDGKGFYYSRYDEPKADSKMAGANYFHKLYYHRVGTPQSEDVLVYHRPDQKEWLINGGVTDDGRYLIINVSKGSSSKNALFYKDLQVKDASVVEMIKDFDANYGVIDNDGPVFYVRTNLNAPKGRIIAIDTRKPERDNWKELVPQANDVLGGINVVNDMLVTSYLKDARTQLKIFDLNGKLVREVQLPGIGSASNIVGQRKDKEGFYSFQSYTTPSTIYRYDMVSGKSTVFRQPKVDMNPNDYETKQVFYTSKDGTRIPMFISHRKGLKLDGGNPTLLYGYGGFNSSQTPGFSVSNLVWMEMGGVFAVANLRGGGEYGKEWHEAGTKLKKQNVFDDFIAAGEWLISNKYTQPSKLAVMGGSNGGLLVGAVVNQRPELFGAALPAVGVMDMLRFHKFTIGWAWVSDYGSPDNPEEFRALYAYSPYHNLKPGTKYPAILVTTADHDDRVVPSHSFKYAARLQEAQAGPTPVLIRIETKAGHGSGKPITKTIEEVSDKWGFLVRALNMQMPSATAN